MDILKAIMEEQRRSKNLLTLGGRIRFLRASFGLTPKGLADRVARNTGQTITPEAVRKWEKDQVKNLEIANLYALADIFDINAKWIALGPLKNSPLRPLFPSEAEKELVSMFRQMTETSRTALLALGKQILASQSTTA